MARFTVQQAAETAERYADLTVLSVVDTRAGSGFVLTEHAHHPATLGVAAVDVTGDYAPLGMNEDEVRQLRDALTAWLDR
jgi:hypothetical protein